MRGTIRSLFDSNTGCIHIRPQEGSKVKQSKQDVSDQVRHQMELNVCLNCTKRKCTGTTKCMIETMKEKYGDAAVAMYYATQARSTL